MIACDVNEHRELVGWMAKTLMLSRRSEDKGMFDMWLVTHYCGSPMCMAGHALVALGRKYNGGAMETCRGLMGFPIDGERDESTTKKAMLVPSGEFWFSGGLENCEAFRRWTMTLNYRRRQLAQLEVDAGEWGRPKPARDMPVGQERERQVLELVGGAV